MHGVEGGGGRTDLLEAVRRLSDAWRADGTPERVLAALTSELEIFCGATAARWHPAGEHAPDDEPVGSVLASGRPLADGSRTLLPLLADADVRYVVEVHGGGVANGNLAAALTLTSAASAALAVLDAQATARVDALTGLLNRAALLHRLRAEIAQAERSEHFLACLMLDLDDFKAINDGWGHVGGDEALRRAAEALTAQTRPYDHLARYGGDEFAVILPGLTQPEAEQVAERIHAALRGAAAGAPRLTWSIGIATWRPGDTAGDLIDRADQAARSAKAAGKNRTSGTPLPAPRGRSRPGRVTATPPDGATAALAELLAGRGLRAVFQPIVDLSSRSVVGYEALTRGPAGSPLERPDRLLAAARDEGLLVETDTSMRQVALHRAAEGGLRAPCTLFVNCEPETAGRLGELEAIWTRDDAPFESVVEITERMVAERPAQLLSAVNELRAAGWGIAVDDVGADERALALLPFLRPDVVKLDLRLVQRHVNGGLARVAAAAQAYAEESGAAILAEGIETERHLAMALALGATLGQGYLFGRPGALPESIPPATVRMPNLPPPAASLGESLFGLAGAQRPARRAPQGLLDSIAHQLESQAAAMGPSAVVLARLDGRDRLTARRLERLGGMVERVGFVGAVGPELGREPAPGVRGGTIAGAGPSEWALAILNASHAAALVARATSEAGDEPEHERTFDYFLTHDRALVTDVARSLIAHVAPGGEIHGSEG